MTVFVRRIGLRRVGNVKSITETIREQTLYAWDGVFKHENLQDLVAVALIAVFTTQHRKDFEELR